MVFSWDSSNSYFLWGNLILWCVWYTFFPPLLCSSKTMTIWFSIYGNINVISWNLSTSFLAVCNNNLICPASDWVQCLILTQHHPRQGELCLDNQSQTKGGGRNVHDGLSSLSPLQLTNRHLPSLRKVSKLPPHTGGMERVRFPFYVLWISS